MTRELEEKIKREFYEQPTVMKQLEFVSEIDELQRKLFNDLLEHTKTLPS